MTETSFFVNLLWHKTIICRFCQKVNKNYKSFIRIHRTNFPSRNLSFKMNFLAAERRGIAGGLSESAAEADAQGLRGVLNPATKF